MTALLAVGLVLFVVSVVLTAQDRRWPCWLGRHRWAPTYCTRCGAGWAPRGKLGRQQR